MRTEVRRSRVAAVVVGACAQVAWAGCWAADAPEPPAECKAELTDDDVSVSVDADTKDKKTAEIVAKIEKKLPDAFTIPRHEDLERIVRGMTRKMVEDNKVVAADLGKGIAEACNALHGTSPQSREAATAAGFEAAGLRAPPTNSANFATKDSKFAFMTGVVNSLEADGSWKSAVEASFVAKSQFLGPPLESQDERAEEDEQERTDKAAAALAKGGKSSFSLDNLNPLKLAKKPRVFGRFEATWSSIGKIDDEQAATVPMTNPFAAGGGILRLNIGPDLVMGQGWWGLTGGIGLTTQPTETEGADVDARRRWYAGLLFLADYGTSEKNTDRMTGRVAIGYSDDRFWEWTQTVEENGMTIMRDRDESKRWFLDARIDGPGVFNSDSVKLSLRMFVDHPTSGDGPTDIRVSLLITADLGLIAGNWSK